jgi:uroporphyrinogen-III synthase
MSQSAPSPRRLSGRRILLTRPQAESQALAARIAAVGGHALVFPTLEIRREPLSPASIEALHALPGHRLAVFVSTNAVHYGMPLIRARGGWPPALSAAAVGHATADLLRDEGVRDPWVPLLAGGDSAALLAHPELQHVAGWSVVVFRGVGGREVLAEGLRSRGARVSYVECYRRAIPPNDPGPLRATLDAGGLDAVVAASAEGLRNLLELVGPGWRTALQRVPLVVTHANIRAAALGLGFEQVALARDAHEGVVECLADLPARHAGGGGAP